MEKFDKRWMCEIVVDSRCSLGEGPLWEEKLGRLLWVDIIEGTVHVWYSETGESFQYHFPFQIGAIAPYIDGTYLVATNQGIIVVDLDAMTTETLINPERNLPNNRFNDGKLDSRGRFWVGTMDQVLGEKGAGKLYMLDEEGQVVVKIDDVSCSNGLGWSRDNRVFYFIDTPTQEVVAYDFDESTGGIENRRVVINVPVSDGLPDGMTIDEEGMLWTAQWGGAKVVRWNPDTGDKLKELYFPVTQITSCTFGGEKNKDMYITSARVGLTDSMLKEQPHAGALFVIKDVLGRI